MDLLTCSTDELRAEIDRQIVFALRLADEIEAEIDAEFMLYGNERFQTPRRILEA